jgi:hypothetical protein
MATSDEDILTQDYRNMLQMPSTKTTELMKPYWTWMIIGRSCKKILFMLTRKPKMTATALHSFNKGPNGKI